jgi:hypothetical protein
MCVPNKRIIVGHPHRNSEAFATISPILNDKKENIIVSLNLSLYLPSTNLKK